MSIHGIFSAEKRGTVKFIQEIDQSFILTVYLFIRIMQSIITSR